MFEQNFKNLHSLWFRCLAKKILLTISNLRKNSKNSDKENYVQSGYGITFDKAGSESFYNGTARNATTICTDITSSSHAEITRIMFYC